ncbi:hypothetical protein H5410_017420 [Solanum commersonii]|uniref:O-methyltransferase C-terminal domain-containing protein n=1 Tax=Solanum commersonii TaxID=4109 RepID=A0A9J6A0A6_SOLCO|nr:hypothetical protein H5410_017420 [Solanum commersonii]
MILQFLGFSKEHWLPLSFLYLDALLQKIENKYSFTSKQVIVEDVSISVATIFSGEISSPLVEEHSSHVDNVEGLLNTFINDLSGHVDNMLDEMSIGVFTKKREETSSASSCVADLDYSKSPKVFNECFPSCCPLLVADVQPDTLNKMLDEEAPGPNHSVAQLIDVCSPKDMSKRYVTAISLVRSSNIPKIEFETCEDLYLAEFFLEPATIEDLYYEKQIPEIENCIPQSTMPLDDMMLVIKHENYTEELNAHNILCQFPFNPGATFLNVVVQETVVNFYVWNPGISFKSKSLICSTMKEKSLLLLRSTIMFCSIAYANSVILVWDPGWQIPDIIHSHGRVMTLFDLVESLSINKSKGHDCIYRLMCILIHDGFFIQEVEANGDSCTPFATTHGKTIFEYAEKKTKINYLLNEAMASDARLIMSVLIQNGKGLLFEGLKSLVDVGGCKNLSFVGGDMFNFIPSANTILFKKSKEAIPNKENGGRVIIIDMVLMDHNIEKGDDKSYETQLLMDMVMTHFTNMTSPNDIIEDKNRQVLSGHAHILNLSLSFINTMSLKCAIQLGIPDSFTVMDEP